MIARGQVTRESLPAGSSSAKGATQSDAEALARVRAIIHAALEPARESGKALRMAVLPKVPPELPLPTGWKVEEEKEFPAASTGVAENEVSTLAVLHVHGTGEERALQAGEFLRPFLGMLLGQFLRSAIPSRWLRFGVRAGLAPLWLRMPLELRRELLALSHGAGIPAPLVLAPMLAGDLHVLLGCSTFVALPPMTAPDTLLFGRNLDFDDFRLADIATLLTVHHPPAGSDDLPYAGLGWAGVWGTFTGWNAAGLCLSNMQAYNPPLNSPGGIGALFAGATPTSWAYTMLLRECRNVEEALRRVGGLRPISATNLMLADRSGRAALVEWDANGHRVREPENGCLYATNFFLHPEMAGETMPCHRLEEIERQRRLWEKHVGAGGSCAPPLPAEWIRRLLGRIHQNEFTLHTVLFRPCERRVEVAVGPPPSALQPWQVFPWDVWESGESNRHGKTTRIEKRNADGSDGKESSGLRGGT
jgi:hypothetical protein